MKPIIITNTMTTAAKRAIFSFDLMLDVIVERGERESERVREGNGYGVYIYITWLR